MFKAPPRRDAAGLPPLRTFGRRSRFRRGRQEVDRVTRSAFINTTAPATMITFEPRALLYDGRRLSAA